MSSTTSNEIPRWLRRPLCRRYAFAQLGAFLVPELQDGVPRQQPWYWAFAMFAPDEFEVLGAWPAYTIAIEPIIEDLRNRGVLNIRVVSVAEAIGHASTLSPRSWATALQHAEPRMLEVVGAQVLLVGDVKEAVEGAPAPAIRSALSSAARIQDSLLRAARSREPFASAEAASEFIATWLQKADRRLNEVRRSAKPELQHAA